MYFVLGQFIMKVYVRDAAVVLYFSLSLSLSPPSLLPSFVFAPKQTIYKLLANAKPTHNPSITYTLIQGPFPQQHYETWHALSCQNVKNEIIIVSSKRVLQLREAPR